MPEKEVVEQAQEDLKEGKSPSTAAGEFVHEEIEHVREGKHGARSPQQAIAIGLSKARQRRYSPASTEGGKNQRIDASKRSEGLPQRTIRYKNEDVGQTVAGNRGCLKEGTTLHRLSQGTVGAR